MNEKECNPIESNISFADASLMKFDFEEKNRKLILFFEAWNEKIIKVHCENVLYFLYQSGSYVSQIYQKTKESSLLSQALKKEYENIPANHSYKEVIVVDIEDEPIIHLICENLLITFD